MSDCWSRPIHPVPPVGSMSLQRRRKWFPRNVTPSSTLHLPRQLRPPLLQGSLEVAGEGSNNSGKAPPVRDSERMGKTKPFPGRHCFALLGSVSASAATKGAHCWALMALMGSGGAPGPAPACLMGATERANVPVRRMAPASPVPRIPRTAPKMNPNGCCCPDGAVGPRPGPVLGRLSRTLSRVPS